MKRICFLAFGTFPLLSRYDTFYDMGGSELQQVLIGKELVNKGYDVIFIDFDYGQNQFEIVQGITVIKTFKPKLKTNIWEYLSHVHILFHALLKSKADIFYQRTGIYFIPNLCAKIIKKPLVYAIPSDRLVNDTADDRYIIRLLRKIDVFYADHVVVQSDYQKKKVKQYFNDNCTLIKSICILENDEVKKNPTPLVLWVSTLRELKNPDIFLDLARHFPSIDFCMIGGPSSNTYFFHSVKSEAEKIANLRFLGFVPLHLVDDYFKKAWIFVNTSAMEGFPNTFFQAWSYYTPVVSLNVDPDEVISTHKLGFHSGNFSHMVRDLDILLKDEKLRIQFGLNGRMYVEKEHNVEKIILQYIDLFETIEK